MFDHLVQVLPHVLEHKVELVLLSHHFMKPYNIGMLEFGQGLQTDGDMNKLNIKLSLPRFNEVYLDLSKIDTLLP